MKGHFAELEDHDFLGSDEKQCICMLLALGVIFWKTPSGHLGCESVLICIIVR